MDPYLEYLDDDSTDMKQKLKAQLNDLQEEVKSFCSDRPESPGSSFNKHNNPGPRLSFPGIKEKSYFNKGDELIELKKEVQAWSGCIKNMQKTIENLGRQLSGLEQNFVNKDYANELQDFKEEIIQEIKNMEFGTSSFRDSLHGEGAEEVVRKMLRNWEEEVYRPQMRTIEQRVMSKMVTVKEDPQDIMRKLKEKLALKAELEKRKMMLYEGSESEDRFRMRTPKF